MHHSHGLPVGPPRFWGGHRGIKTARSGGKKYLYYVFYIYVIMYLFNVHTLFLCLHFVIVYLRAHPRLTLPYPTPRTYATLPITSTRSSDTDKTGYSTALQCLSALTTALSCISYYKQNKLCRIVYDVDDSGQLEYPALIDVVTPIASFFPLIPTLGRSGLVLTSSARRPGHILLIVVFHVSFYF